MAMSRSSRLVLSRLVMMSRSATGVPAAMLTASWRMLRSPLLAWMFPPVRAVIAASQSIAASWVPSVMPAAVQMEPAKWAGGGRLRG
jgi:hypothetical protein